MGYKDYYDTKYFFDKLNQNYEYLLQKFYKKLPYRIYQGEKRKKIGVIYTCVTGEYDNIDRVPFINSNFDFYYISDKKRTELSDMYYIDINDVVPKEANTSVLKARYCKTHPHTLFEEYQVSIYFDGKLKPFADFSQWVYDAQKTSTGIGGVKHPERNCIYMEGIACDVLKKAKK